MVVRQEEDSRPARANTGVSKGGLDEECGCGRDPLLSVTKVDWPRSKWHGSPDPCSQDPRVRRPVPPGADIRRRPRLPHQCRAQRRRRPPGLAPQKKAARIAPGREREGF
jgi:hypothetical protein